MVKHIPLNSKIFSCFLFCGFDKLAAARATFYFIFYHSYETFLKTKIVDLVHLTVGLNRFVWWHKVAIIHIQYSVSSVIHNSNLYAAVTNLSETGLFMYCNPILMCIAVMSKFAKSGPF